MLSQRMAQKQLESDDITARPGDVSSGDCGHNGVGGGVEMLTSAGCSSPASKNNPKDGDSSEN